MTQSGSTQPVRDSQTATGAPPPPPIHVAIIMDGNGRWATSRGLPRVAGHRAGVEAVRRAVRTAGELGLQWLTLYAFSSENWRRPLSEIIDLTGLLRHFLRMEIADLHSKGVRLHFIGDRTKFDPGIQSDIAQAEKTTNNNAGLNLVIALSYGGRAEIVAATRKTAEDIIAGILPIEALDENSFAERLSTAEIPDPDLIIRTSGEKRLSNFLLWQGAYAELLFVDTLWPDFGPAEFTAALAEFARRDRRFGARPG
jgi:undecaprenyl diphosphate synthase